jgi:REP element-mobilizing transposase RayT
MNRTPLAYFLTFSTYGNWLHGAAKEEGSVDRKHNAYGEPFLPPDPARERAAACRMAHPPYILSATARVVARDAIVKLCSERGWFLSALHVRTNHVHAVVSAEREPERLMSDLKARASRELSRLRIDAHGRRWTRHGSTRYLFDEASVAAAVAYTLDEQGERMAVYDPREMHTPGAREPLTACAAHSDRAQRAAHGVSGTTSPNPAHEVSGPPGRTERAAHEVSGTTSPNPAHEGSEGAVPNPAHETSVPPRPSVYETTREVTADE